MQLDLSGYAAHVGDSFTFLTLTGTTLALPGSWNARQTMATDITDDGVVVGYFTDNSTNLMYGFLATPVAAVPEPSSVALLLAGALALGVRRHMPRRREPAAA